MQNQRCPVTEPERDRPDPQEQPFVKGLMQEAKSELRTSFRWAVWGAGLGAIALAGAGLWYFGTTGLVYGAAIGAVAGGVGAWLLHVNLVTDS